MAVFGSLVGAYAHSQLPDHAAAAPPSQAREDQITIWSEDGQGGTDQPVLSGNSYNFVGSGCCNDLFVALDPQDYPASATFRLETVWFGSSGSSPSTRCFRLFDKTSNAPVTGSEVCHTATITPSVVETVRLRSAPFTLAVGEHEYEMQGKSTAEFPNNGEPAIVNSGRIIAEWTERR